MAPQHDRVDELEKTTQDLQAAFAAMATTVGGLETSMCAVAETLTEVLAKLEKIAGERPDPGKGANPDGLESKGPSSNVSLLPRMDLPSFDGADPLAWLAQAEQYFLVHKTAKEQRVQLALIAMSGKAMFWAQWVLRRAATIPWEEFSKELIARFGDSSAINAYEALHLTRQTGSLEDYLALFEERVAQLPSLPPEQYLGTFLGGLQPTIRDRIPDLEMTDVFAAIRAARRIARASKPPMGPPRSTFSASTFSRGTSTFQRSPPGSGQPADSTSVRPPQPPEFRNSRRMSPAQQAELRAKGLCFRCKGKYSPLHKCPERSLAILLEAEDEEAPDTGSEQPESQQDEEPPEDLELKPLLLSELSSNGFDGPRTLKLFTHVKGRRLLTMVDSGASHCFISSRVARELSISIDPTATFPVTLGNGTQDSSQGVCRALSFLLAGESFSVPCYVFPLRGIDLILGVSWLAQLGDVTSNWVTMSMEFVRNGRTIRVLEEPSLTRRACPRVDFRSLEDQDDAWMLWVMEGDGAASFSSSPSLSDTQHEELGKLLSSFSSVTQTVTGLPPSRRSDHRIVLQEGTSPVSVRPYRYNHSQKDEMEKLVAEMLAAGIIQPSCSPYSSPVLLVRKKDGSWRFCVDYRALNKVTVADKYPIPVIQELLDELHGACWFSKLDLRAGYHQIRIAPEDVHKTAFRTHSGHYEFLVMPFGLTNAPATFQCLMNDIFRPFLRKFVLVFFDDILVYSSSWSDHLRHLHQTFTVLRTHSLVVNPKKCAIGNSQVEYLGHIVSSNGVQMDPAKVGAVLKWPTPKSIRGLRGFLGLTGYYRRFIRDYGKIAAPLTNLLKKENLQSWHWTLAAEEAFNNLKRALTTAPVLCMPDFSKAFEIECDASGRGLGAVLMQEGRPIAYFSKNLSGRILFQSAYEKELMALVLAVQHWRPYLLGRRFIVRTDQRSLKQLLAQALTTPAQQNWAAKLLGFDFQIVYKEGKLNKAADALSRRDEDLEFAAVSMPHWLDWSSLQNAVRTDPRLSRIIAALEEGREAPKHYSFVHGTLFYKGRVVLPSDSPWIAKLFTEFHSTPSGGHSGAFRTYRRLASNLYWPGMMKMITALVAACDVCQKNKYETKSPAGLLSPLPIPDRVWKDVSMDFITGLPRSGGFDCILVVVDRLSKYCHFMGLRHPFTAKVVAEVFAREVIRLHGMPESIVSDRDPVFLSSFWKELFKAAGTTLRMSSAYHPETDGQTEVMNRCLETYLRCFASERPTGWGRWLSWAEFCFNTGFQSSAGMTPFEVVYGRPPPLLIPFLPGEVRVQAVADSLRERDDILAHLRQHLERAQQRMVKEANKHRRQLDFKIGDKVYLKFRPYRQRSLFTISHAKLSPRFFGPFEVEAKIGAVAYRLKLPEGSKVHPVFHVSLLKPAVGQVSASSSLPEDLLAADPPFLPEVILQQRWVRRNGADVEQVLVKWKGLEVEESSWEDVAVMKGQFPDFSLEDKAVSVSGAIDSNAPKGGIIVYTRKKKKAAVAAAGV